MSVLVEPYWQLEVTPTPLEHALLEHPYLRHLAGIHHAGLAAYIIPIRHSRLDHTLGVYALSAHFRPNDESLRTAALLHDIGHVAFSHAAEVALGINHHARTLEAVHALSPLLQAHGLDACEVIKLIDGPSPLRPGPRKLGLDHLESFVRCGAGPARQLLDELSLVGDVVSVTVAGAAALLGLIERELLRLADKPTAWADWLSGELLDLVRPAREALWTLSDEGVLTSAKVHPEGRRLLSQLHQHPEGAPGDHAPSRYANYPLVAGVPAPIALPRDIERLETRLAQLPTWQFSMA